MKQLGAVRFRRLWLAMLAVLMLFPTMGLNCSDQDVIDAFRLTAGPGLSSGIQSVLNAVVDGVFAAVAPQQDTEPSE